MEECYVVFVYDDYRKEVGQQILGVFKSEETAKTFIEPLIHPAFQSDPEYVFLDGDVFDHAMKPSNYVGSHQRLLEYYKSLEDSQNLSNLDANEFVEKYDRAIEEIKKNLGMKRWYHRVGISKTSLFSNQKKKMISFSINFLLCYSNNITKIRNEIFNELKLPFKMVSTDLILLTLDGGSILIRDDMIIRHLQNVIDEITENPNIECIHINIAYNGWIVLEAFIKDQAIPISNQEWIFLLRAAVNLKLVPSYSQILQEKALEYLKKKILDSPKSLTEILEIIRSLEWKSSNNKIKIKRLSLERNISFPYSKTAIE